MLYSVKGVYYQGDLSMLEQWILGLDIVSQSGFLGTRATFLIDTIISFLVMLPIIIMISIFIAKRDYIKLHQFIQFSLLLTTIGALALFFYNVNYIYGFENTIQQSSIDRKEFFTLFTIHVIIVIIAILIWSLTIFYAFNDNKRRALPGVYSKTHKRAGRKALFSIILMVFTSLIIYWVLYIF